MKNIVLTSVIFVLAFSLNAQIFGIRTGADFSTAKADLGGINLSENQTGFYIGAFTKIKVSEKFTIRPEANYVNIKDSELIEIPILAEYGISEKFNLLAGPSFGFLMDTADDENSFNLSLDFGLSYDITKHFLIEARYELGLSNLTKYDGANLKLHGLFVGIGYMF